jgi:hypothetical protein
VTAESATTDDTGPPPARRRRRIPVLAATLIVVLVAAVVIVVQRFERPSCLGDVGFNWPNAGRVYLGGLTQKSTTAQQPTRPFAVAQAAGVPQVRVFVGVDAALDLWRQDPQRALAAVDRMVADAETHNIHLVMSNYPDLPMISALAGHGYPSWEAAQQDLTTPGSPPYARFGQWLADVIPRISTHPSVAAWEVVNEPGYMLGIDKGSVEVDAGLAFVSHFADLMHRLGARTVAGGGRPVFDPARLSDAQLATYAEHIDVLDDHLYPETAVVGDHGVSAADARAVVAYTAAWFDRTRQVTGRPDMPAMLGEVASEPAEWFAIVQAAAAQNGWPVLAWGFDAYDENDFTDLVRPNVLQMLGEASRAAAQVNGRFPVLVGTPKC